MAGVTCGDGSGARGRSWGWEQNECTGTEEFLRVTRGSRTGGWVLFSNQIGNTIELKYMKGREKVTFCVTPIQQRWRTNGLAIRVWCQHGKTAEEVTVWGQQDAEFRFRATELECLSRHPGAPAQWARNTGSHQGFLADTLIPDLQPPELGDSNFIALSHPSF